MHSSGYPVHVVTSVAEQILRVFRQNRRQSEGEATAIPKKKTKRNVAAIPYIHAVGHRLKKIGNAADVQVVFSAPRKLAALCKKTYPPETGTPQVLHRAQNEVCRMHNVGSL